MSSVPEIRQRISSHSIGFVDRRHRFVADPPEEAHELAGPETTVAFDLASSRQGRRV